MLDGMNRETSRTLVLTCAGMAIVTAAASQAGTPKRLVAHRGASSYVPEHTASAYRLAITQGADYVEQDLAVTRDGVLVCLHDGSLERTTNVEEVFPDRSSLDEKGRRRWLVADFTLAEIKRLDAGSWFAPEFAGERILTWDEAVAIVRGKSGLYPELKTPALYRGRGINIVQLFADAVRKHGLDRVTPRGERPLLAVQSFDEIAVRDLAATLPAIPRTFLIGGGAAADRWLSSAAKVNEIASFATGIGPAKALVEERPQLVGWAHSAGLTVTPYTFRSGSTGRFPDVASEMRFFLYELGVDALFTDNPDRFPRSK